MKPFPTATPPSQPFLQCMQQEEEEMETNQDDGQLVIDVPSEVNTVAGVDQRVSSAPSNLQGKHRFPCPLCGKIFRQLTNLIRHRRLHATGPMSANKKSATCPDCRKVFSRPDNMKRHRKTHNADRPDVKEKGNSGSAQGDANPTQSFNVMAIACPECGDVFPMVSHMMQHLQNDHMASSTSSKPITQPFQPVRAMTAADTGVMDEDRRTDTSQTYGSLSSQPQKNICPMCDKAFNRCDNLKRHIQSHHVDSVGLPPPPLTTEILQQDQTLPLQSPITLSEDPRDFPADYDDSEDILNISRKHWIAIRTHYTTGRRIQDVFNFRLVGHSPTDIDEALKTVFQLLRCRAKINLSFGFILRNSETGQLRYYHASQNNTRLFATPEIIAREQDMDRVREKVRETDVLQYGIRRRPDTKWTVAATTNLTVYVNKMPQFPIGSLEQELPPYVANNRGLKNLVCNWNSGKKYVDSLCFFRCLAVHRRSTPYAMEKTVQHLVEKYRRVTGKTRVNGVTLDELAIAETVFEVNVQVYMLMPTEVDDELDGCQTDEAAEEEPRLGKSTTQVDLVRRSHRRYPDTMYLNLWGNHFSYISDLNKYSKCYACSKCGTVFTRSWNLMSHELTCDVNVKHKFSGGSYQLPLTIFDKLSEIGIDVDEDMKYFPYRATFDYECYFQPMSTSMIRENSKLRWENRHELLSVSVASNIPDFEEPRCFVTNDDPAELVSSMVRYLHTIGQAAYTKRLEKFEFVFKQLDELNEMTADRIAEQEKEYTYTYADKIKKQLDEYLQELPVLGFNSGKYDINIIKRYLYPILQKTDPLKLIIKRTSTYMALKTEKLKFLDISNYLAPGYSYSKFLKAYECPQTKGFFPYEWVDDLNKLDFKELPPHQAFYSKLKGCNISDEEYGYCQNIWKKYNMSTMREFLIWYNNLDVVPFLDAVAKMFAFYQERHMDMFKSAISVPGLSLQYLFLTLPKDVCFTLVDEKNKDLYYKIKNNIVGGPSIVFHRYHEKGKTFIRGGSKQCRNIVGFDANALYLWSLMQDMPVGTFVRRTADDDFRPIQSQKWGVMATEWMEWVARFQGIHIQHQFNAKEKRVGGRQLAVDGFCKETNTVYQFHGCFWHGHRCHLNTAEYNHFRKSGMDELKQITEQTSAYVRQQGYTLVEMWECQWRQILAGDHNARTFVESTKLPHYRRRNMTQREVIDAVMDGSMFGLVECDIEVPEELKDHFAEMPPIFKNVDIRRQDIGDHMRSYAEREGMMKTPRRSLIGSMFGKRVLLATPLIQWYINHGLEIRHVYEVIQFRRNSCFKTFGDAVSDARRAGDSDPTKAILADTMKLLGNSAYGKTVTNQERHLNVRVCNDVEAPRFVNKAHFRALHAVDDDVYEVDLAKRTLRLNLPLHIGFFVYQFAKLRMLEFYYDFLLMFVHPSDFQMCEMDTDSAYLAISGDTLDDVIKEDMREQYLREKHQWFPRDDTAAHRAYDKRTPGLFKIEWEGDGIIALCSKTYYCFGSKNKISCKGLNKANNDITKEQYMDVLTSQTASGGINRGFRMQHDGMYTYEQAKTAFSYLYPKRKVAPDGVTTTYLDL